MVSLIALDIGLTYYALKHGHSEKNPLAKFGFKHIGFIPSAILRLLIAIGLSALCVWSQEGFPFLLGLVIFLSLVVLWNTFALTRPMNSRHN